MAARRTVRLEWRGKHSAAALREAAVASAKVLAVAVAPVARVVEMDPAGASEDKAQVRVVLDLGNGRNGRPLALFMSWKRAAIPKLNQNSSPSRLNSELPTAFPLKFSTAWKRAPKW